MAVTVVQSTLVGGGTYTLGSLFNLGTVRPDDIVFWSSFDTSSSIGGLVGTNAVSVISSGGLDWKGYGTGYVKFGLADDGAYGFSSVGHQNHFCILRGLGSSPVETSSVGYFYSGGVFPGAISTNTSGPVMMVQYVGGGNRHSELSSVGGLSVPYSVVGANGHYVGVWLSDTLSPATLDLRYYPDGTGGSGGDSWASVIKLTNAGATDSQDLHLNAHELRLTSQLSYIKIEDYGYLTKRSYIKGNANLWGQGSLSPIILG